MFSRTKNRPRQETSSGPPRSIPLMANGGSNSDPSALRHIRQEGSRRELRGKQLVPQSPVAYSFLFQAQNIRRNRIRLWTMTMLIHTIFMWHGLVVCLLSSQLQYLCELTRSNQTQPARKAIRRNPLLDRVLPIEVSRPAKMKALLNVYFRDMDSYLPFLEQDDTEFRIQQTLTNWDMPKISLLLTSTSETILLWLFFAIGWQSLNVLACRRPGLAIYAWDGLFLSVVASSSSTAPRQNTSIQV